MVRAGDRLDLSPGEAERSMQRSYKAGLLSYPRADARGVSRSVARKLAKILRNAGYRFDQETVPEKPGDAVHDAPYPIGRVNLALDPRRLGADEGIRVMVARDLVRSGQKHGWESALTSPLDPFLAERGFSPEVRRIVCGLEWRRERGPRYPGQEAWPRSDVIARRPDTALLEAVIEAGLGRPSTWATHIEGFLSRGLVDDELRLTAKGKAWLAASPPELTDPRISAAIERACERARDITRDLGEREPWEVAAERIVRALPASIRGPIEHVTEPPRPRIDPWREHGILFSSKGQEAPVRQGWSVTSEPRTGANG